MKKVLTLGLAVALVAAAGAAMAYPSLLGPTGGTNLPTAKVVKQGTLAVAYDYFANDMTVAGLDMDATSAFRLLYGVTDKAELGITYNTQEVSLVGGGPSTDFDNWGLNDKYNFAAEDADFEPAAGVVYQDYNDADFSVTQLYLVGSKLFRAGEGGTSFRGSLGVNWTKVNFSGAGDTDAFRPYINLDFGFSNGLTLTGELQLKDSDIDDDPLTSLVLRYPFSKGLAAQLGISNEFRGVAGGPDHSLTFGITWNYDPSFGE